MDSYDRRRFLADLLNIPPVLLGIVTHEQVLLWAEQQQSATQKVALWTPNKLLVDITRCRTDLKVYQESNYANGGQALLQDISMWMKLLHEELPHVSKEKQRIERYELLIGYNCLMATILRDLQDFDQAILYANEAVHLATDIKKDESYAVALCRRGKIWLDKAAVTGDQQSLHAAMQDLQVAYSLEKKLPQSVLSSVLLNYGNVQARYAQPGEETRKTAALNMMDRAGGIARSKESEDDYSLRIEVGRYHVDKGDTLAALMRPNDAISELSLIVDNSENKRRNAYRDVFLAQAYLQKGEFDYATQLVIAALPVIQEINAKVCIARIVAIYQQLKESSFRNDPEVARLDYLLRSH